MAFQFADIYDSIQYEYSLGLGGLKWQTHH